MDDDEDDDPMMPALEAVEGELLDAANFALTTDAVEMQMRQEDDPRMDGATAHFGPPPTRQEILQQKIDSPAFDTREKFTVPARVAEQGRKAIREAIDSEEAFEKQKILNRILKYYTFFPQMKANAPKKGRFSQDDPIKTLIQEEERIKHDLNDGNAYEAIKKCDILFTYYGVEVPATAFGIPAQGLAMEAKMSQHIVEQELKEFAVLYGDWFSTGPEWRYMLKKLAMLGEVMKRNQGGIQLRDVQEQLTPEQEEDLAEKYKNL